ncbi:DDE-type integrase/transposase/recombinase [Paenibacillus thiaminolyticus]|nr:DDE-type integrase/transposase/recombinase [Paenibacillus thiaminolyticus]
MKAPEIHVAENVMNRNFDAYSPNTKWCTDVTELKYGNGRKAYLSAIIDVYDNSIVSWILSHSNNNKLVMDTLKKAYKKNPGVTPLLQSDRGFQYTSHEYNRLHIKYGFMKSMSRVSHCLDNQPIERFGVLTNQKAIILQSMIPMKKSSKMLTNTFAIITTTAIQSVWVACHLTNTDELHNEKTSALLNRAEENKPTIFVFYTVHLTGSTSISIPRLIFCHRSLNHK